MTPGSREGIGIDGKRNPSRKPDGCDEEESGEQASEERSTKGDDRVEILNPSATGLSSGSAQVLPASPPNRTGLGSNQQPPTSSEPAPPCHDQHHFLRSSVRPPSKRIRKDSISAAINGHGGAKSKGTDQGVIRGFEPTHHIFVVSMGVCVESDGVCFVVVQSLQTSEGAALLAFPTKVCNTSSVSQQKSEEGKTRTFFFLIWDVIHLIFR